MTLASARLKGGHPTGVMLLATTVRMSTVASPASSRRTSLPASRKAAAQTNGKLARVGFSDPTSPMSRNFCPSAAWPADVAAEPIAAPAIAPAQRCEPFSRNDLRFGIGNLQALLRVSAAVNGLFVSSIVVKSGGHPLSLYSQSRSHRLYAGFGFFETRICCHAVELDCLEHVVCLQGRNDFRIVRGIRIFHEGHTQMLVNEIQPRFQPAEATLELGDFLLFERWHVVAPSEWFSDHYFDDICRDASCRLVIAQIIPGPIRAHRGFVRQGIVSRRHHRPGLRNLNNHDGANTFGRVN